MTASDSGTVAFLGHRSHGFAPGPAAARCGLSPDRLEPLARRKPRRSRPFGARVADTRLRGRRAAPTSSSSCWRTAPSSRTCCSRRASAEALQPGSRRRRHELHQARRGAGSRAASGRARHPSHRRPGLRRNVGAEQGTLAIMAGGEAEIFARVEPILHVMGRPVHVGPHGAGQLAKLANQIIVGVTIGAVAEALLLAQRGGADPAKVREALRGGFAESRILELARPADGGAGLRHQRPLGHAPEGSRQRSRRGGPARLGRCCPTRP